MRLVVQDGWQIQIETLATFLLNFAARIEYLVYYRSEHSCDHIMVI